MDLDTSQARAQLDQLKSDLDSLTNANVNVTIDLQGAADAKAQIEDLAKDRTATIKVDLQGASEAAAQLDELAKDRTAAVKVDLQDAEAARASLDELSQTRTTAVRVDLSDVEGARARLDELARTRHARVVVDVDKSKLDSLKSALSDIDQKLSGLTGRAGNFALALAALAPALVPLTVVVGGLAATMVSAFATAGLALAPFALSIGSTVKSAIGLNQAIGPLNDQLAQQKQHLSTLTPGTQAYADAQKQVAGTQAQINGAMAQATPVQRQVAQSLGALQQTWKDFQKQAEKTTGPILASGFDAVSAAIPKMLPLVQAVAPIFQDLADKADAFAKSNGMNKFVDWIIKVGVPNLKNIMDTIGHLFVALGQLIKAFAPDGESFTKWLSNVTKKLDDWGKGGGFQRFADKVRQDWPEVKKLLEAAGKALEQIVKAMAGMSPATISGLTVLLQAIGHLSPGQLQALAAAFIAIRGALVAMKAVKAVSDIISGLGKIAGKIGDIIGALRIMATAYGFTLGGMMAVIALVVLIVGVLIYDIIMLVKHWHEFTTYMSQSFMHAVHDVWELLKSFASWISGVFSKVWDAAKPLWSAAFNGLKTAAQAVSDFFRGPFLAPFKAVADFFKGPFLTPFKAVGTFFSGPFIRFFTDTIPKIAAAIAGWVAGAATGVAHFVTSIGQKIGQFFSGPFIRFFTDVIPKIAAAIGRWTAGAASAVAHFVTSIGQKIGQFFSGPFIRFFTDELPKIVAAIGRWTIGAVNAVGRFVQQIGQKIGQFFSGPFIRFFTDEVPKIAAAIGRWTTSAVAAVGRFVDGIGKKIGSFFSGPFVRFFTDAIPKMASAIGRWAAGVAGAIGSFFAKLAKDMAKGVSDLVKQMLKGGEEIAKNLIQGLIHGLESGIGGVLHKAEDLGKKVLGGLKKVFKIFSPSMETHQMGLDLNNGLGNGIDVGAARSLAAAAKMAIGVINHLKTAFTQMQQVGMHAMELLIVGFQFGMASLLNIVQSFGPRVTAAFKSAMAPLKTEATQAMTDVNNAIKTGLTTMEQSVTTGTNQIKTTWQTFTKTFETTWTSSFSALKSKWTSDWTSLKAPADTAWNTIKTAWTTFSKTFETEWNTAFSALKSKWQSDWNSLKAPAQTAWNALKTAWTTFTKTFQTAWNSAFSALKSKWTADWNALKTAATTVYNTMKTDFSTFVKTFQTAWTAASAALKAKWDADWNAMKTSAQTIWDTIKTAWTKFGADLNTAWNTASQTLQASWKQTWTQMNSTAQSEWNTIKQTIGTAVNAIIKIVNGLISAWNSVAGAVDLPHISPASPVSFATGGIVGGYSGGGIAMGVNLAGGGVMGGYNPGVDTIPAMLSEGEGVLVPEAVRGLGHNFVHEANHHFSGGRAGHRGNGGGMFSGGRHHFATGGVAGGSSGGIATGAFGLPDPAAVRKMFDPLIKQLRSISGWSHGAGEKFGGVGQKMEDKIIAAIQAKIAAMMAALAAAAGAKGTAVSGNVKNLAGLIAKALAAAGIPATAANIAAMERRIMIESSGNPNAINNWDINAQQGHPSEGLAQITTTNFAIYGSGNILDPLSNLTAAAKYIVATYGGVIPQGAAYARGTNNAASGWALVGEEGPEMVNFGGGESVLDAGRTRSAFEGHGGHRGGGECGEQHFHIDMRGSTSESVDKFKNEAIPQLRMALQAGVGKKGR